jgi:hypothetical protein
MYVIGAAGHAWNTADRAPFGVGNVSKADLSVFPPHSIAGDHTKGTGIDIRPVRTDGRQLDIRYDQPGYDREATQALVNGLLATGGVEKIFFNDLEIKGVQYEKNHDNHLHVRINPNYKRPAKR